MLWRNLKSVVRGAFEPLPKSTGASECGLIATSIIYYRLILAVLIIVAVGAAFVAYRVLA